MTPSQWHDDVRNRDAGHDAMQIAVFDYLRDMPTGPSPFYECNGYERTGVYFEMPFRGGGHILAWGDVVEVWQQIVTPHEGYSYTKKKYVVWEIKPKIYSVGAVVRQCVALEDIAKSALMTDRGPTQYDVLIIPAVTSDDPKLGELRHVHFAAAWDGERLS